VRRIAVLLIVSGLSVCLLSAPGFGQDALGGPAGPVGYADFGEPSGGSGTVVISDVPSYIWYHGCGPTAAGMIIGYWDAHGFSNLIVGSNDWSSNQTAVKAMIASEGHIRDYVPTPDRVATLEDPYHPDDCVADFGRTSRNPLEHGWAYYSYQDDSLRNYAIHRGYETSTAYSRSYSASLWDYLTAAIDDNHPVELLVDSDGNGSTDHFITMIGYDDTPGAPRYACMDTWSHTVRWEAYHQTINGDRWGVYGATFFSPAPEPVFLTPLLLLAALKRRRRQVLP